MTDKTVIEKIDLLSSWAVISLRTAQKYDQKDWGDQLAATFRGNAACYNQSAGLFAADCLGIASLTIERPPAPVGVEVTRLTSSDAGPGPRSLIHQPAPKLSDCIGPIGPISPIPHAA